MPAPTPIAIPPPLGSPCTPMRRSPTNNGEERYALLGTAPTSSSLGTPRKSPTSADRNHQHSLLYSHAKHVTIFILFVALAATAYDNQRLRNHQYRGSPGRNSQLSSPGTPPGMNKQQQSNSNNPPAYSILPKKIYSVIGLESSGTQFVSKIIEDATKTGPYREGSAPCNCEGTDTSSKACFRSIKTVMKGHDCNEQNKQVQVQHFSLPWGGSCHKHPNPSIVDVVLPPQCTRDQTDPIEIQECNAMTQSLWGIQLNGKAVKYPIRYNLDIVKNKQWYDEHGVEQVFVIVIRDDKISYAARSWHCNDEELRRQEEEVGSRLIEDAIHEYILNDSDDEDGKETKLKKELLPYYWSAKQYQEGKGGHNSSDANNSKNHDHDNNKNNRGRNKDRRRLEALSSNNRDRRRLDGALPSKNNVVIVSYESLIKLGPTYVKMLYETLGIESDYIPPEIKNGNEKYLNNTWT